METVTALACLLVVLATVEVEARQPATARCGTPRVAISVSPLIGSKGLRELEVSWSFDGARPGDEVALYDHNPSHALGPPLVIVRTKGLQSGRAATGKQERHVPSHQLGYTQRCLYWVEYRRPSPGNQIKVLAVGCLRTRPTWMSDIRSNIKHLRLVDLFIPGTHNSASYREEGTDLIEQKAFDMYTITQDESVLGQLIYGVRHIDLRVGYYGFLGVKAWWANHDVVPITPLADVLSDIKDFLANTNEIVILDIHRFPWGFENDIEIHLKLVRLLETELGDVMAYRDQNKGWESTLEDLWTSGRRLIVAYNKNEVLTYSRKLWPAVYQYWPDVQTPKQLTESVTRVMSQQAQQQLRGSPWALMAELTPNPEHIYSKLTPALARHIVERQPFKHVYEAGIKIWHGENVGDTFLTLLKNLMPHVEYIVNDLASSHGLRELADSVNHGVSAWADGPWGEDIKILAVDFVRSTDVVEAAIRQNLRRGGVDDVCNAYRLVSSV